MARVIKRVAAKRDLTDHFVFLGDNASVDVARRFLHACNVSFQALAHMPELGTQRSFRNPRFSSVGAGPVKGFERYLIFCRPLTDGVEILRVIHCDVAGFKKRRLTFGTAVNCVTALRFFFVKKLKRPSV